MVKAKAAPGIDGFARTPEQEDHINRLAASVLGTTAGRELVNYMKSITINRIMGGNATDGELRHMEGQRFIVAILEARLRAGIEAMQQAQPAQEAA